MKLYPIIFKDGEYYIMLSSKNKKIIEHIHNIISAHKDEDYEQTKEVKE